MYEHGSFGSVPAVFSVPLVSPSLSQSAAAQTALAGFGVAFAACTHGSNGAVSVLFGVPSPSQSALFQAVLGVSS